MFNQQSDNVNDFTPSWLKLSVTKERRPQSLHWLHNNNNESRKADSILQKDDFPCLVEVSTAQRRGGSTSAWSAPLVSSSSSARSPTPPTSAAAAAAAAVASIVAGQSSTVRNNGNRMYKAMLPRNLTRRVLAPKSTNQTQQNGFQQDQQQCSTVGLNNNNNVASSNSKVNDGGGDGGIKKDALSKLVVSTEATASCALADPSVQKATFRALSLMEMSSDSVKIGSSSNRRPLQNCFSNNNNNNNDVFNQNVFVAASPCYDEAEERLLRAMGWKREEVADEEPLTPEEITEATHWGHYHFGSNKESTASVLGKQQKKEQLHDDNQLDLGENDNEKLHKLLQLRNDLKYSFRERTGNNSVYMQRHEPWEIGTALAGRPGQLQDHAIRMGADLKKALLATMGVLADSDLEEEDDNDDSDNDV